MQDKPWHQNHIFWQKPILETPRLLLRPFERQDVEAIFGYACKEEVARYVSWNVHKSIDDSLVFLENTLSSYHTSLLPNWAIVLCETNCLIGSIGLHNHVPKNRSIEIGYVIDSLYWNKGYVTEAVQKILEICFLDLELNRVAAIYEPDNIGSGRVMEKVGMLYEGYLREYFIEEGIAKDVKLYAILKSDWQKQRQ